MSSQELSRVAQLVCVPTTTTSSLEGVEGANEGSDYLPPRIARCFPELGRHFKQWQAKVLQMKTITIVLDISKEGAPQWQLVPCFPSIPLVEMEVATNIMIIATGITQMAGSQ